MTSAVLFPPALNPRVPVPPDLMMVIQVLHYLPQTLTTLIHSNTLGVQSRYKTNGTGGQSDGLSAVVPFGGIKYC